MVFLRFKQTFGNGIADTFAVQIGLGNSAYHVDNGARDLVRNFVRIDFGQIVGKDSRRFVSNGVFVNARNRNFFAYAFRHIFIIGRIGGGKVKRVAQYVGNDVGYCAVIEPVCNFF